MTKSPTRTRSPGLRHIMLASLALVLLLLTGAQFLVTGSLTERQLLDIESESAFTRLRKLHRALDFLAEDLNSTATDWAQWEQMHRFAAGTYPEFPEFNLVPITYTGLRLDLVAIIDTRGSVVFAKHLAKDGQTLIDMPADFVQMAQLGGPLYTASLAGNASGLVDTTLGAYLVSVQPIRSYYGEPLRNARLIMGRSLLRFVEPSLERVTGEVLEARAPSHEFERMYEVERSPEGNMLRLDDNELEAVTRLLDLWDQPVTQLHLRAARPTQALVRSAQTRLLIAALIIGGVFCVVALALLRRKVVSPLERLANAVERMGEPGGSGARVPLERSSHELETLSAAINAMIEQRDEQQAMRRDRDAAVEANRLKSEFLAIMSHEIRTPMNGVLGMCELLQHTQLDARQKRMSDTIVQSAQSLLGILSDILDFSKIEAGRLELDSAAFAPAELIEAVAAPHVAAAQSKGIALHTRIASNVPANLFGDVSRLRQVLGNLLSNAVKFTEHGSVSLSCEATLVSDAQATLRFVVKDTGIGIAVNVQEHIFEPFAQGDSSTSRRFGGTGLGLAIVRRLARLMHGEVQVDSEVGHGAVFTLTVPLLRAREADAAATQATDDTPDAKRVPEVLLAEDNAVNREVLKEMLEYAGARVTVAENGAEALALANFGAFDVILMDCHMPVMDGLTAVAALRRAEVSSGRRPAFIVALTADVTAENRARCLEAGMNDLASKPISQARLQELIHSV